MNCPFERVVSYLTQDLCVGCVVNGKRAVTMWASDLMHDSPS